MIHITKMTGFSAGEIAKLKEAEAAANAVIATPEFQALGPAAVELAAGNYPLILQKYRPLNPFSSAIAYQEGGVIHLSAKALGKVADVAGTLVHENLHTMGYTHPFWPKSWRHPDGYTRQEVPYLLGDYIAKRVG